MTYHYGTPSGLEVDDPNEWDGWQSMLRRDMEYKEWQQELCERHSITSCLRPDRPLENIVILNNGKESVVYHTQVLPYITSGPNTVFPRPGATEMLGFLQRTEDFVEKVIERWKKLGINVTIGVTPHAATYDDCRVTQKGLAFRDDRDLLERADVQQWMRTNQEGVLAVGKLHGAAIGIYASPDSFGRKLMNIDTDFVEVEEGIIVEGYSTIKHLFGKNDK